MGTVDFEKSAAFSALAGVSFEGSIVLFRPLFRENVLSTSLMLAKPLNQALSSIYYQSL